MSFALILPYLRAVEHLIKDEEVSEILVNADGTVFSEREGLLKPVPDVVIRERERQAAVRNIARLLGDDISEESPLLDSRLPDGSRVAAVMPPASVGGTIIAIRKFRSKLFTAEELVRRGMMTAPVLECLRMHIADRRTVLISGGTGTGKTTLLNALCAFLPPEERIVVIEDTSEIALSAPDLVRLEAQRGQPGREEITIGRLLKQTLRLRPDRIIVGEVRDGAAFDLLQALNTGHAGTLSTIHANTARDALSKMRTYVSMAGVNLPDRAIARMVADVVHVVVQLARRQGLRHVTEVVLLDRYDSDRDAYVFADSMAAAAAV